jgi:hypothetical protein
VEGTQPGEQVSPLRKYRRTISLFSLADMSGPLDRCSWKTERTLSEAHAQGVRRNEPTPARRHARRGQTSVLDCLKRAEPTSTSGKRLRSATAGSPTARARGLKVPTLTGQVPASTRFSCCDPTLFDN